MDNDKSKEELTLRIASLTRRETETYVFHRVYFFHKSETLLENLEKRFSRPQKDYKKLLPAVFKRAHFLPEGDKQAEEEALKELLKNTRWSQKAGCKCGCSPGFIVKADASDAVFEIFVTVKVAK